MLHHGEKVAAQHSKSILVRTAAKTNPVQLRAGSCIGISVPNKNTSGTQVLDQKLDQMTLYICMCYVCPDIIPFKGDFHDPFGHLKGLAGMRDNPLNILKLLSQPVDGRQPVKFQVRQYDQSMLVGKRPDVIVSVAIQRELCRRLVRLESDKIVVLFERRQDLIQILLIPGIINQVAKESAGKSLQRFERVTIFTGHIAIHRPRG